MNVNIEESTRKELAKLNHSLYAVVNLPDGTERVFACLDRATDNRKKSLEYLDSDDAVNLIAALSEEEEAELRDLLKEDATGTEEPLVVEVNEDNYLLLASLPEHETSNILRIAESVNDEMSKKIDAIHDYIVNKDTTQRENLLETISYLESLLGTNTESEVLEASDIPALKLLVDELKESTTTKLKGSENTPLKDIQSESPLENVTQSAKKETVSDLTLEELQAIAYKVMKEKKNKLV